MLLSLIQLLYAPIRSHVSDRTRKDQQYLALLFVRQSQLSKTNATMGNASGHFIIILYSPTPTKFTPLHKICTCNRWITF